MKRKNRLCLLIVALFLTAFFIPSGLNMIVHASTTDTEYIPTTDTFYESSNPEYNDSFNIGNPTDYTGHYNATYSFENDVIGSVPEGWINYDETNCFSTIIENQNGHNKVLQLNDTVIGYKAVIVNKFINITKGTIELWFATSDYTQNTYVQLQESESNRLLIAFRNSQIQYSSGVGYIDTGITPLNNTWFHVKIIFDCITDTYDLFINGLEINTDINFIAVATYISNLRLNTLEVDLEYISYFDAIGYSWDGYNATYSFNDDIDGDDPVDFVLTEPADTNIEVVNYIDNHYKILEMEDFGVNSPVIQQFFDSQTSGTIEFWTRINSTNQGTNFYGLNSGSQTIFFAFATDGKFEYYDGASYIEIMNYNANQWYHIKWANMDFINFEYDIYIDNILKVENAGFKTDDSSINKFQMYMGGTANLGYIDGLGYSWDSFYEIGDNLKHYSISDNIVPYHTINETINQVDKYEFTIKDKDVLNENGLDNPNGWTDIEETGDTVNIQTYGNGKSIYMSSTSGYLGIVKSDFNSYPNTIGTERINVSFNWCSIDNATGMFMLTDYEIRSSDNTLITRIRLEFFGNPTFESNLQYYNGSDYINLDDDVASWFLFYTWYDFNIFIDYPSNMVTFRFNNGTKNMIYHFPTLATNKSGLKEVRLFSDENGGNIHTSTWLDSIGVWCDGLAINDEFGWKSIDLPSNWNLKNNNLFLGNYDGWANISVCNDSYSVGVSDFYDLFSLYYTYGTEEILNLYTLYSTVIIEPYLIIYQTNFIDDIYIGWMDVRNFTITNLSIEGVKLVEGINERYLIYDYSSGYTDPFKNYFYESGSRVYYTLTCENSNLEYIQATFDIKDVSAINRSVDADALLQGTPFLFGEGAFNVKFTDATTLSFVFIGYESFNQILPQSKVIKEFVFLITDDDNDLASGNTMTGSFSKIVLVYYPNISVTILTINFLAMLIPLLVLIIPPLVMYKRFGSKIVIWMLMFMAIVCVATSLIPVWIFFILMFCFISYLLVQKSIEGGIF